MKIAVPQPDEETLLAKVVRRVKYSTLSQPADVDRSSSVETGGGCRGHLCWRLTLLHTLMPLLIVRKEFAE